MVIPPIDKSRFRNILKTQSFRDIIFCLLFVVVPIILLLLPVLAISENSLAGMGFFLVSSIVLLSLRKWKLFIVLSVLTSLIFSFILFFPQSFWENIILLTGRSVPESWNPPFLIMTPLDSYKFAISIIFPFMVLFLAILFYLITGFSLYTKNKESLITRFFLLSFVSFGLGQGCNLYLFFRDSSYTILHHFLPYLLPSLIIFLLQYSLTFLGLLFLWSASSSLILPRKYEFRNKTVILSILSFLSSLGFILIVGTTTYDFVLVSLEFELFFLVFYAFSFVTFPCSAFLQLRSLPDWFTPTRRRWVKRVRMGLLVLIFYGIFQTIKNFQGLGPVFKYLLFIFNIVLLCLTIIIIYSGLPEVTEWFFDEIKIRATPEMKELNSTINLEHLWQLIDTWKEDKKIPKEKMTETAVASYVREALGTLRS
ncbi:MAG: hypothetical protein ACFFB5_17795 [Promethearchaeota archaeon]